jgi:PII-like signaling protein
MRGCIDEQVLMRIHVGSVDRYRGQPLFRAIVELLRARGFAGVTVLHSIMAFGSRREVHSLLNELTSADLSVVIECIDSGARIEAVLPELDGTITSGLVTLERAGVILYRPRAEPAETSTDMDINHDANREV